MSFTSEVSGVAAKTALKLARDERGRALSPREWKHRLAGYGYGVKETQYGTMLTDLIGGRDVCALPSELTY